MSCSGVAGEERLDEPNDVDERAAAEETVDGAAAAGEVAVEAEKDAAKLRAVRCPLSRLLSSSSRSCVLDRLAAGAGAGARAGDGDATRAAEPCACAEERIGVGAGEAAAAAAAAARECVVAEYLDASVYLIGGEGGTRIWKLSKSSSVSLSLLYANEEVECTLGAVVATAVGCEGAGARAGEGAAERGVCARA